MHLITESLQKSLLNTIGAVVTIREGLAVTWQKPAHRENGRSAYPNAAAADIWESMNESWSSRFVQIPAETVSAGQDMAVRIRINGAVRIRINGTEAEILAGTDQRSLRRFVERLAFIEC